MSKYTFVIVLASSACVARAGLRTGGPPPPPPSATIAVPLAPAGEPAPNRGGAPVAEAPHGNYAPGEDAHWFQSDDYFISAKPYQNKKITVRVAKMTAAATGSTKAEAHFLLANGEDIWTATFFRSRIPSQKDLRVGALAFCHAGYWTQQAEPPKDKHAARQGEWIIASITDTADLYKGRITVGDASCAVGAVRVPVQ